MADLPQITKNVWGDGATYGINSYMDYLGLGNNARQAQFNEEMARLQMSREDTAYQRAVADMRKAGLNPALMYSNGGASPSGASASAGGTGSASGGGSASGAIASLIASASRLVNSEALENTANVLRMNNGHTNAMSLNKAPTRSLAKLRQSAIKIFLK